ncbi:hypothetical protein [Leifsonia sp. RAF41]|uniref:hypothetical protein n=1 Tax=Leifsonia sp. RAF41 TaxID=3233056 RepID=UPI003F9DEB0F
MTEPDRALLGVLEPALREAIAALSAPQLDVLERARVSALLASAAEEAQRLLGELARDPRIHRIVGAASSAAMALSLADGIVPLAEVSGSLQGGLRLLAAGSWPPEDQDPAE